MVTENAAGGGGGEGGGDGGGGDAFMSHTYMYFSSQFMSSQTLLGSVAETVGAPVGVGGGGDAVSQGLLETPGREEGSI